MNFFDLMAVRRRTVRGLKPRLRTSWSWSVAEFEAGKREYQHDCHFFESGEKIWETRSKAVFKLPFPGGDGTKSAVFKYYSRRQDLRFAFFHSKAVIEAVNYRVLEALGFPMAKVIFCSEERKNFILHRAVLATEFVSGSQDGRCFVPGGALYDSPLRMEFMKRNFTLLAKLHAMHVWHKGPREFNFLWQLDENGEMKITWIDVATCHFMVLPEFLFRTYIEKDFGVFFRDLLPDEDELDQLIGLYLRINPRCGLSAEKAKAMARLGIKKHNS